MRTPTAEQEAVIAAAKDGASLVVTARAGTGKTTTIEMAADAMAPRRGLYIAFNKAIIEEAAQRMPHELDCKTAHSLAFRPVGSHYRHRQFNRRVPASQIVGMLDVQPVAIGNTFVGAIELTRIVLETIDRFCHSYDEMVDPWHVPKTPPIDSSTDHATLAAQVIPYAKKAWKDIVSKNGQLPFKHDYYLKMYQLSRPRLNVDYVMLDEAQDANPVIASIIMRQNCQKIVVGDPAQQLYAWRGAIDAMDGFPGKSLPLTQSFRFGPAIAEEANRWLNKINEMPFVRGTPQVPSSVGPVERADAVLCRTNAGAFAQAMREHGSGRSVGIVGGVNAMKYLAEAALALQQGRRTSHPELFAFTSWEQLQEYVEHERAGQDLKVFVKLIDSYGASTVIEFCESMEHPDDADVIISTVHKAKGLEWDRVRLASDYKVTPKKDGERILPAEVKIAYVAVTRAKLRLDKNGLEGELDDDR